MGVFETDKSRYLCLICFGVILMLVCGGAIAVVSVFYTRWECTENGFGLVFDAGSSHTSLAVYEWPVKTFAGTGVVSELFYQDNCGEEGISSYADNPSEIKRGLTECLDKAEEKVPESAVDSSPVYLAATSGMRMLKETDPGKSDAVFKTVRETIREYPFEFEKETAQANILTGKAEGYSAWITANYLDKRLGVTPALTDVIAEKLWGTPIPRRPTLGALDLGGASTQIAFMPEDPSTVPDEYKAKLRLYGTDYEVYTHSFQCYGINEARRRYEANLIRDSNFSSVTEDPCAPKNYSYKLDGAYLWNAPCSSGPQAQAGWGSEVAPPPWVMDTAEFELNGTADLAKCLEETRKLFSFSAPCPNPPCSFNGVHTPMPNGSFQATSNFYYALDGIGASGKSSQRDLVEKRQAYCAKTYEEIEAWPGILKFKLHYCFRTAYVGHLLEAYGFDDSNWNLDFNRKIGGITFGWGLGYMLEKTNRIRAEATCSGISPAGFYIVLIVSVILFIHGLILFFLGLREKLRIKSAVEIDITTRM